MSANVSRKLNLEVLVLTLNFTFCIFSGPFKIMISNYNGVLWVPVTFAEINYFPEEEEEEEL